MLELDGAFPAEGRVPAFLQVNDSYSQHDDANVSKHVDGTNLLFQFEKSSSVDGLFGRRQMLAALERILMCLPLTWRYPFWAWTLYSLEELAEPPGLF